jgi:hypothetical protein
MRRADADESGDIGDATASYSEVKALAAGNLLLAGAHRAGLPAVSCAARARLCPDWRSSG